MILTGVVAEEEARRTKCYVFTPPTTSTPALTNTIYPNADGAAVSIQWSGDANKIIGGGWETSSGSASGGYSFTNFDNIINTQLGFGAKSIVVILSPISFNGHNNSTPNYVFTAGWAASQGVPQLFTASGQQYVGAGTIPFNTCAQGVDNTAFPVAFQPAFTIAWKNAINAALAHMKAASYASKIAYIRIGGSAGGEWVPFAPIALETQILPSTSAQLQIVWAAYCDDIEKNILAQNSGFKFDQGIAGGFGVALSNIGYSFADALALVANNNNFGGIGGQGLQGSDITFYGTKGTTSGGTHTSGWPSVDWVYNFATFPRIPILQLQTVAATDPTGAGFGSLVPLLPFATSLGANHLELYYEDWRVAYDPTDTNYATYHVAYASAIQTARRS